MNPKLLVVDDDRDFAESLGEMLEMKGYDVTVAFSGEEALEIIETEAFSLVLLDMKMGGMNGIACLEKIRAFRPGTKVLMITAFSHTELVRQALAVGAVGVLHKPVAMKDLMTMVGSLSPQANVLLVEDDKDFSESLKAGLAEYAEFNNAEMNVTQAFSLAESKALIEKQSFELLLVDFSLPDGTAPHLLEWLKVKACSVPVIIMTGFPQKALDSLPSLSLSDIMVKPFQPENLLERIKESCSPPTSP